MELYKPHIVFELEGEVHVVPASFFEDVIAGRAKYSDLANGEEILLEILSEWLFLTKSNQASEGI
jgi:hypothetical protein